MSDHMQSIKTLKGSPFRDEFKRWHKHLPDSRLLWSTDIDFALTGCNEILAILDVKRPGEGITGTEKHAYNWFLSKGVPVYFVIPQVYRTRRCPECDKNEVEISPDSPVKVIDYGTKREILLPNAVEYVKWESSIRCSL